MSRTQEVLRKAVDLTGGDRAKQHGNKLENHENIAALWSAYLGQKLTAHDAAVMMVLLKCARTKTGSYNLDDYVDMAGYSGIAAEVYAEDSSLPKIMAGANDFRKD